MNSLHSRTFAKSQPAALSVAMPSSQRAPAPRPAAAAAKPPQILQSGHAPAQLSFTFTRW